MNLLEIPRIFLERSVNFGGGSLFCLRFLLFGKAKTACFGHVDEARNERKGRNKQRMTKIWS